MHEGVCETLYGVSSCVAPAASLPSVNSKFPDFYFFGLNFVITKSRNKATSRNFELDTLLHDERLSDPYRFLMKKLRLLLWNTLDFYILSSKGIAIVTTMSNCLIWILWNTPQEAVSNNKNRVKRDDCHKWTFVFCMQKKKGQIGWIIILHQGRRQEEAMGACPPIDMLSPPPIASFLYWRQRLLCLISNFVPPW